MDVELIFAPRINTYGILHAFSSVIFCNKSKSVPRKRNKNLTELLKTKKKEINVEANKIR